MELWIRSQDRKKLEILQGRIKVQETQVNPHSHWFGVLVDGDYFGEYNSEEKALEILDEIHQRLLDLQMLKIAPDRCETIERNFSCVYEMPEE